MDFDPYDEWLKISTARRPPTHYDLLGLAAFESDVERIRKAAMARSAEVRKYCLGDQAKVATRVLGELAGAMGCLTDDERKSAYDTSLRESATLSDADWSTRTISGPETAPRPIPVEPPAPNEASEIKQSVSDDGRASRWKRPDLRDRRRLAVAIAAGLLVASCALAGIVFSFKSSDGLVVVDANVKQPQVFIDGARAVVTWENGGKRAQIHVKPGTHQIKLSKEGFVAYGKKVVVNRGGRRSISARLRPVKLKSEREPPPDEVPHPAPPAKADEPIASSQPPPVSTPQPPQTPDPSLDAATAPSVADAEGFVALFNGKDLAGWKPHPSRQRLWDVKDGILVGSGPESYLYTDRGSFRNFHLRVETRINDGGNSGVFCRCQFGPILPVKNPRWPDGYEAQINSTHADKDRTGSLHASGKVVVAVAKTIVPPNVWCTLEIIATDDRVAVKVNSQTTADYRVPPGSFPIGHIALQQHDPRTVAEFRKIEIRELAPGEPGPLAGPAPPAAPPKFPVTEAIIPGGGSTVPPGRPGPASDVAESVKRKPVPASKALADARAAIAKRYANEGARATSPARKSTLAQKLLRESSGAASDAERYALLEIARSASAGAGRIDVGFTAAEEMARVFDVDEIALKLDVLVEAKKAPIFGAGKQEQFQAALALSELAVGAERFSDAARAVGMAQSVARSMKAPALIKQGNERKQEVDRMMKAYGPVKASLAKLETAPDDGQAHLMVGKYYCLVKDDWQRGLPHLAQSGNQPLKALSEQELAAPADAGQQHALADGWWQMSLSETESKAGYTRRALYWYARVLPSLSGAEKAAVAERLLNETASANAGKSQFLAELVELDVVTLANWYRKGTRFDRKTPLAAGGKTSPNGILTHPTDNGFGSVTYKLGKKARMLTLQVAIDDAARRPRTGLTFEVKGDGKVLWTSPIITRKGQTARCDLKNLADVDILELRVNCPGNCYDCHAFWIEPAVTWK